MRLNRFEIRRQALHIFIGVSLVFLLKTGILDSFRVFIMIIFGLMLSLLSKKIRIPGIYQMLVFFDRKEAVKNFPGKGVVSFMAGSLLVLQLFSTEIAYASIMVLTFGDSFSHIFGRHLRKIKNPLNGIKSLEGNIIGGFAGFLGAMLFVSPLSAFLGSFGAMAAEAVELKMNDKIVDDNIIVPLAAGTIMYLIFLFL